jgi:hypothetical protein
MERYGNGNSRSIPVQPSNRYNEHSISPNSDSSYPFRLLIYALRGDPVHPISSATELANVFDSDRDDGVRDGYGNGIGNDGNEIGDEIGDEDRLVEVVEFDRMQFLDSAQARQKLQRFAKL